MTQSVGTMICEFAQPVRARSVESVPVSKKAIYGTLRVQNGFYAVCEPQTRWGYLVDAYMVTIINGRNQPWADPTAASPNINPAAGRGCAVFASVRRSCSVPHEGWLQRRHPPQGRDWRAFGFSDQLTGQSH